MRAGTRLRGPDAGGAVGRRGAGAVAFAVAFALAVASLSLALSPPVLASGALTGGHIAVVAQNQPDRDQDDELHEHEQVGHGRTKELSAGGVLATLAVVAGGSAVVVLAGVGVFRRRPEHPPHG